MIFGKRRLLHAAMRHQERGEREDAVVAFQRYLDRAPDDVEARRLCADLLVELDRKPEAIAHYEALTGALAAAGLGLRAIAACCAILRLDPDHVETQRALAELARERKVDPERVMTAAMKRGTTPPPLPDDEVADADDLLVAESTQRATGELGLADIPLFSELDGEAFAELLGALDLWRAPPKSAVIQQGDTGSSVFVIVQGVARVERDLPSGEREWVSILRAGDFFGESAVLADMPRTSTVIAQTELELIEIHRPRVEALSKKHPGIERALRRFQRKRSIANVLQTDLFRGLPEVMQSAALRELRDRTVRAGETIIDSGDKQREFFLVLAGDVRRAGAQLYEGDHFGGLDEDHAEDQIVAKSEAQLLVLNPKQAQRLVARHPAFAERLTQVGVRIPGSQTPQ